jgi:hypothetical protein
MKITNQLGRRRGNAGPLARDRGPGCGAAWNMAAASGCHLLCPFRFTARRWGLTAGLDDGNVTGMALSPAEKQRRYRERQSASMRDNPDVAERALLEEAARCEQLSAEQRVALADRLADLGEPPPVACAGIG